VTALLVLLTVLEAASLVAVLAVYLLLIERRLASIATTVLSTGRGVAAVERQLAEMASGAGELNRALDLLADDAAAVADAA
jgi:hypothetical protein